MINHSLQKQQGIALITVLMILAIMVTIAATMTGRLTLSLKRTEALIFSQSVYWYGQASADFGRMILEDDFSDSSVVSLDQSWATQGMVFPLENGSISGQFKDMRSCFNLNALAVQDENDNRATPITQFQALLESIGVSDYSAEMIAESTRDWIDSDNNSSASQGAEDSTYQGRAVAHLAANNLMVEVSELRAVQGVSQHIYEHIAPYLCAIPSSEQKINVNTVSVEHADLLYALFEGDFSELTLSSFTRLLEDRPSSGWDNVAAFLASSVFDGLSVSSELAAELSVTSEYFQLNGNAEFADRIIALQILFAIDGNKAKVIRYQSGGLK
ncbi:MAG: type II secretion system minor pseudopilin GspK [Psychromonas sp.]